MFNAFNGPRRHRRKCKWIKFRNFAADPRTNDWPLIKSPVPGLSIIGLYLYFVNSWGPRFMKDRKPYQFKQTLIVYNFIQVLISVYLFTEVSLGHPVMAPKWNTCAGNLCKNIFLLIGHEWRMA